MSVLIKGMAMPPSCYFCGLTDTSFINCQAFSPRRLLDDDCEERRPDWCPLVEVKNPHGDLIDMGELFIPALSSSYDNEIVRDILDEAPVVIEAED